MTSVLINLFYLGVLALVAGAAVYVFKTRDPAGSGSEEPAAEDGGGPKDP